jgi:iron complex outermembrane receptor protein
MGSFGERKGMFSSSMYLGKGANLLLSASVFHNGGQDHYFPRFDSPETNHGLAAGVDSERGYHTFANLVWRDWNFTAYFNSREKQVPAGWDAFSVFSDPSSHTRDSRNFVQASHSRDVGAGKFRWHASYNQYRYEDRFDYDTDEGLEDFRDIARGDWLASLLTYDRPLAGIGRLTLGTAANIDLRNLQRNFAVSPAYREQLYVSRPDRLYSLFAQQEWNVARRWTAYLGLRFDASRNYANSLSPRLALVYQRSPQTVYKFVYGRPFRNPSTYESYYYDNLSFLPSGDLRPEKAHTFEVSAERRLRRGLVAIVNVYHYGLRDLIQAVYVPETELQQFQNSASNRAAGVEWELSGKVSPRLETAVSFALQRATNSTTGAWLVNSPRQIGKARAAVPLFREKLYLSGSLQYLSARQTRAGDNVPAVILTDFTATTNRLHREFDLQFGLRNLFDRRYWDPVALAVDRMHQDGRSAFVKLIWRPAE